MPNKRCEGCGTHLPDGPHQPHCPAVEVRVVDKREQKRQAAEDKRLEKEQHEQVATLDPTARADRIQQLKDTHASNGGVLTTEEQDELLRLQAVESAQAEPDGPAPHQAVTAFLVVIGYDGTAQATSDVNLVMELEREATIDDMDAGCHIVTRDIQASMTAKQVVFGMQVGAQAMSQQAQQARAAQAMVQEKLGVPGSRRSR